MRLHPQQIRNDLGHAADPLSDVLSLMTPRSCAAGGFDLGGAWSIGFPSYQGVKCYAVASGQCWLSVEGVPDSLLLKAADCILLPQGRPFRFARDLAVEPVAYTSLAREGGIASCGGGGDCFIVGGHFEIAGVHAGILLSGLSPIVQIRDELDKVALRWCLERMRQELSGRQQPGASLIARHLAHMMLVQALRLHVAEEPKEGVGWLFALADRQMSAVITAVHHDPAHRWTLPELAQHAGMWRSAFALKFKGLVGQSPKDYVTRWRMLLASDSLSNTGNPISVIARSLGYESESAFSTAFKRVIGRSPRQYSLNGN